MTQGDPRMFKSHYKMVHNNKPFEGRNSVNGPARKDLEIIETGNHLFNPRHTCMLLMENSKNMET